MNKDSQYVFYGSLMQGMENYLLYEKTLKFLGKVELLGFRMYSAGQYPYIVRDNSAGNGIVAELYKVNDPKTEQSIHELEMDEGYIFSEVTISSNKFGIYLFPSLVKDSLEILGGDWRQFMEQQRF